MTLTMQFEADDIVERPAFAPGFSERPLWRACSAGWTLRVPFGGPVVLAGLPSLEAARTWRNVLEPAYRWADVVGEETLEGRPLLLAARADALVRAGTSGTAVSAAAAGWPSGAEDERLWRLVDLLLTGAAGWRLVRPGRLDVPVAREAAAEYLSRRLRAGAPIRSEGDRIRVGARADVGQAVVVDLRGPQESGVFWLVRLPTVHVRPAPALSAA